MKLRTNQKGISPLIIILLILLLAVVGFAGWTVYNTNKKSEPTTKPAAKTESTTESTPKRTPLALVKPISEAYRVALPDGWVKGTCADSPDVLFLATTTAKLGKCESYSGGMVFIAKNAGNTGHTEEYYTSDDAFSDVTYTSITIDGISGYKVKYTYATENELGYPAVGTKATDYILFDGTNTFSIGYLQFVGEPDLGTTVQALAESFNKL